MKPISITIALVALALAGSPFSPAADIAQPDLRIGKKRGKQKGNDLYTRSPKGHKTRTLTNRRGKGKFFFSAQNDAGFDGDLLVKASRGNRKIKITYKQIGPGGGNVTGQVTRAGLTLTDVPKDGGVVNFKAIAKVKRKFRDRPARKNFRIQLLEPDNNADPDRGKAKVIKKL